jgi:putative phage-type endonuclease
MAIFQNISEFLKEIDSVEPCPPDAKAWIEDVKDYAALCLEDCPCSACPEGCSACPEDDSNLDICCEILKLYLAFDKDNIEKRREYALGLLQRKQQEQRTTDWYLETANMLTASEFADLLGSPLARGRLVMKKATPPPFIQRPLACKTEEISALSWGVRFEPVVKQILEKEWGAKIGDCGRLYHPTMERLAASPDGFIIEADDKNHIGRLLEIKCPISRKIGGEVPYKYWVQMQIQMEVCGINECDYVEVVLESPVDDEKAEGYVWVLSREDQLMYAYTEPAEADGWVILERVGWAKKEMSHIVVAADKAWFESTLPAQKEFWEDVEKGKRGEFILPVSTRFKKCLID